MDGGVITAIIACVISAIALFAGILQWFLSNIKSDKNKILDEIYHSLYVDLPNLISDLLQKEKPNRADTKKIKSFLCKELKPKFNILKFRSERKYNKIINKISNLEDSVLLMRESTKTESTKMMIERKNDVKKNMKKLYKTVDRIFHFN